MTSARRLVVPFAIGLVLLPSASRAAAIREVVYYGDTLIEVEGAIAEGDFAGILKHSAALVGAGKPIKLLVSSDGGDVREAMKIGRFVRSVLATVKVSGEDVKPSSPRLRHCYSACVLIFIAAAQRHLVQDNVFFTEDGDGVWEDIDGRLQLKSIPVIGIHRPYFSGTAYGRLSPEQARAKYDLLEREVRDYLREMHAPEAFVTQMFRHASNEISLVTKKEFVTLFGYEEPFLEEWFLSKCGALDGKERSDLADVLAARIIRNDNDLVPQNLSKGYVDYLETKSDQVNSCKKTQLVDHQKTLLVKDISNLRNK